MRMRNKSFGSHYVWYILRLVSFSATPRFRMDWHYKHYIVEASTIHFIGTNSMGLGMDFERIRSVAFFLCVAASKCENRSKRVRLFRANNNKSCVDVVSFFSIVVSCAHAVRTSAGWMSTVCAAAANILLAIFMGRQGFSRATIRTNLIVYTYAIPRENDVCVCVRLPNENEIKIPTSAFMSHNTEHTIHNAVYHSFLLFCMAGCSVLLCWIV